jgi:6-phosphogluconolactonase (cycloisomerase 2 family)
MIISCQDGNVITVHKIDKVTGKLSATDVKVDIATPVAVQLVPAQY